MCSEMKKQTLVFVAVVCLVAGCASMSSLNNEYDEFTGTTSTKMSFNPLAGSAILVDDSQVRLQAIKCESEERNEAGPAYMLRVIVNGNSNGWCFIEKGESLKFVIDGERASLSGDGSSGAREVTSNNVSECAVYLTDFEFIEKLAAAEEVKVRVEGSRRNIERHFSKANKKNFQDFVAVCSAPVTTEGKEQ